MEHQSLLDYVLVRLPQPTEKKRLQEIATDAGVPYHTLLKIVKRETADPRISTINALLQYFRQREAA